MKTSYNLSSLFLILLSSKAFAASLSYTELPNNEFELFLQHDSALEISQAQNMIYESALSLCQGKKPLYGQYKFDSKEPISKTSEEASIFHFSQKISCVVKITSPQEQKKYNLSENDKIQIKGTINELTEKYLSAKESGDLKLAYAMLTTSMQDISTFETWEERESKHFKTIGRLLSRDIWRLTIYDNPENSPQPGIYIAADYESKHENSPIYCGYVIWFLHPDSKTDYKVMREEFGIINNEILKTISAADLNNLRKKIGCRAL